MCCFSRFEKIVGLLGSERSFIILSRKDRECGAEFSESICMILSDNSYRPDSGFTCVPVSAGKAGQKIRRFHSWPFVVIGRCKRAFESCPREHPSECEDPSLAADEAAPSIVTNERLLSSTHCVRVPSLPQRSISEIDVCPSSLSLAPDL